jgi:hypothetical protein
MTDNQKARAKIVAEYYAEFPKEPIGPANTYRSVSPVAAEVS